MKMASFEPTRTRYWGVRTSSPSTAEMERGSWWYRSDLGIFCYWDGSSILCWGGSGGKIAEDTNTTVYATGGDKNILVTISGITTINYILQVRFHADPAVDSGNPINEWIESSNVVGLTLIGLGGGTTLTTTVTVRGW